MNLTLATNFKQILICCLLSFSVLNAQDNIESKEELPNDSYKNESYKTALISFDVYKPVISENSFIGQGTVGNLSFKFDAQFFVYKRFFVGISTGFTFLNVNDPSFTGIYNRSTVSNVSLHLGYEQPVARNLNIGGSVSPFGNATYKNVINQGRLEQQRDYAKPIILRAYISYNISTNFSVYLDYSFRSDKTEINTAPEIQDNFSKIQYHNIGLGIGFYLGKKPIID
ncbi:hypothetical protein [Psychroserpens sp. Hel_I_66]|uniref:hypothetical protein n=1 Tax=Psychroserpens sp. Hel_I_66 TaxID=1250004 RepID=UPI0006455296|nr:hypothetical protein [Psychroserpens sp. Hel_I_66]